MQPGRPVGAINKITRSLRRKVLDGFGDEDGVTQFVRDLKRDCPAAAAGLLARMIPPGEPGDDAIAGPVTVNIITIPVGAYLVGDPPRLVTEEEAERLLGKKPTPLIAPPVAEPIASDCLIEADDRDRG